MTLRKSLYYCYKDVDRKHCMHGITNIIDNEKILVIILQFKGNIFIIRYTMMCHSKVSKDEDFDFKRQKKRNC